jgi:type III pantothenate kinase
MSRCKIAIEVGNSRIKIGFSDGFGFIKVVKVGHDEFDLINLINSEIVAGWQSEKKTWVLAGVVPSKLDELESKLLGMGHDIQVLKNPGGLGIRLLVAEPESVGVDRVLCCLAARHLAKSGGCLVVDAGTALTINWVNGDGAFEGGAIQPGWALMARSLGKGTARLPEISSPDNSLCDWPGSNTQAAIRAGLSLAMVGSVKECWAIAKEKFPNPSLWITGGDGAFLQNYFGGIGRYYPNLVLEGMILAKGN